MNPTRLVDYFQQKEKISKQQADEVKVELTKSHRSEEALLLERNLVSSEEIAKAKSEMFNIPYVDLREIQLEDSVFSSVSIEKLKRYHAVPFQKAGHVIKVAMSDPFDIQAIQALENMIKPKLGGRLLVHIATQESVDFVLDSNIGGLISSEVSQALEDVDVPVTQIDDTEEDTLDSSRLQNAPVARIVNSIFQYAIKAKASDVHIEPQETQVRVRFRIHGVMIEKLMLPKHLKDPLVARLKILSELKIDEKRVPQDGRLQIKSKDLRFDVRVSTLPSIFGEKVVLRLLDGSAGAPPIETTGIRGSGFQVLMEGLQSTNGIILVTGPTGSGKTRTLAGALGRLNKPDVNIVTIEDPVEIRIPGVTQVQINPTAGLTFASGLRSILRQDPDIIMVGEIRDEETAHLAVEASLTGHLVLATLHTNSAASAIPRLLDMGIENYLLASTMRISMAQRLPRRVCPHCIEAVPVEEEVIASINEVLGPINGFDLFGYLNEVTAAKSREGAPEHLQHVKAPEVDPAGNRRIYLYKGKGCARCGGTGYNGRIGIFEVMKVDDEINRMIMKKATDTELEKTSISKGMITMIQDGFLKALEGITTIEEVLRVSRE